MEPFETYPWLLAAAIFLARMVDVGLGTLRTILVFRGHRLLAAAIGFVEILIWVVAAGQVLQNLGAWYLAVAYAGGFAAGNVVGCWLDDQLALGSELVRAISENRGVALGAELRHRGYSVTELVGTGDGGVPVEILFLVERRRRVPDLLHLIHEKDPEAICTISDVKRHFVMATHPATLPSSIRTPGKRK